MKRTKVSSSQIKSIGYDKDSRTLEIEFNRGGIYSYTPVTESGHKDLVNAESIGSYFHTHIKSNTTITCTRIN